VGEFFDRDNFIDYDPLLENAAMLTRREELKIG
jgi:hypothetical protein